MCKMIPTDFVLTLPNILGHRCTCIKSHDQSRLISPRVRREFLIPVKMAENLVGYVRKNDVYRISKIHAENESDVDIREESAQIIVYLLILKVQLTLMLYQSHHNT